MYQIYVLHVYRFICRTHVPDLCTTCVQVYMSHTCTRFMYYMCTGLYVAHMYQMYVLHVYRFICRTHVPDVCTTCVQVFMSHTCTSFMYYMCIGFYELHICAAS